MACNDSKRKSPPLRQKGGGGNDAGIFYRENEAVFLQRKAPRTLACYLTERSQCGHFRGMVAPSANLHQVGWCSLHSAPHSRSQLKTCKTLLLVLGVPVNERGVMGAARCLLGRGTGWVGLGFINPHYDQKAIPTFTIRIVGINFSS